MNEDVKRLWVERLRSGDLCQAQAGRTVMNENVKRLWVERLRSGGIEQLRGNLGTVDGKRCPLGVLCDIAVANGVIPTPDVAGCVLHYGAEREEFNLPAEVQTWAGLDSDRPAVAPWGAARGTLTLDSLNDDLHMSFADIADLIEREL